MPQMNLLNATLTADRTITFPNASGTILLGGPYVFPLTDGLNGQTLVTDGAGTVSWQTVPEPFVYINMGIL